MSIGRGGQQTDKEEDSCYDDKCVDKSLMAWDNVNDVLYGIIDIIVNECEHDSKNKNVDINDICVNEYVESPSAVKTITYVDNQGVSEDVEWEHYSTPQQREPEEESTVTESVEYNILYHNVNGWSEKKFMTTMTAIQKHNIDIFAKTEHKKRRRQDVRDKDRGRMVGQREGKLKGGGGGASVWVRKGKFVRVCKLQLPLAQPQLEEDQLWLALDTGTERLALGAQYVWPVGQHCKEKELL